MCVRSSAWKLPGGKALAKELARLDAMVTGYQHRYGNTPYAVALHRAGIARFHLTYRGIGSRTKRQRPSSKTPPNPVTERGRPVRSGPSSGGASGPKTGGKK